MHSCPPEHWTSAPPEDGVDEQMPYSNGESLELVTDINGENALVRVHDNSWADLTVFSEARKKAEAAEAAAQLGALRSSLRYPDHRSDRLRTQHRVIRLSVAGADLSEYGRAVRIRISALAANGT